MQEFWKEIDVGGCSNGIRMSRGGGQMIWSNTELV